MSRASAVSTDEVAAARVRRARKAALAAFLGGMLEYYDYFIYGSAAALIFGDVFFGGGKAAMLASFATFGVAYGARPFGAVLLGHLGDRLGRKKVLVLTLVVMGSSTFLIGCLPTYDQVGWLAPVLLVLLRLGQGLSAGGETAGASSLTIETAPDHRRGFYSSFGISGINAGIIAATLVFIPVAALSDEHRLGWGWRVPFWLSAIVLVLAYVVRRTLEEPEVFVAARDQKRTSRVPIVDVVRTHGLDVVRVAACGGFFVVSTVVTVFALAYATKNVGIPSATMLWITSAANVVGIVVQPSAALLSDRIGRRPVFIAGVLGAVPAVFFYFHALSTQHTGLILLAACLLTGLFYSTANGVYPAFFTEMFDVRVRYTGVAIGLQIGLLIAGFTPMIASAFVGDDTGHWMPVAVFTALACTWAAVAALTARETFDAPLAELGTREPLPVAA